jgi:hypothetical protein
MAMKTVLFLALVAGVLACPCANTLGEPELDAFNPAQSLDFIKGFINGLEYDVCITSYCYVNTTFAINQI